MKKSKYQRITERIPGCPLGTGDIMKGCCIFLASHAEVIIWEEQLFPVDGGCLLKINIMKAP